MKIKTILSICLAVTAFAVNAENANSKSEVLVSVQKAESAKRVVAFDLVSDGTVAGFDFEVKIPGLVESSVNAKSCVSELPKGFNGACRVNNDSIVVTAIGNGTSDLMPNGMSSIGRISYAVEANLAKAATDGVEISSMYLSDGAGQKKASDSKILEQ